MARTIISGGGANSRVVKNSQSGQKVEPKSRAVSPEGIGQFGLSHAFKPKEIFNGPGYSTKPQGDTGIANASKGPAGAAPGGFGRTIYKSGSQSPTPVAREMPAGRNTPAEFGPDSVTARGKR
jgi:hypothetical protein